MDALSDDGSCGLTIIAFIGSVFSPYYAWSGRHDPANHCALNVALYGPKRNRWAMTERGRDALATTDTTLTIGPSHLEWDGTGLTIHIDEITAPLPSRIRGTVRLIPSGLNGQSFGLDRQGRHHWRPIAPRSRVEVALSQPDLRWSGSGYFDTNAGSESLEEGFVQWNWSRAEIPGGAAVLYDPVRRDGDPLSLALRFDMEGRVEPFEPPHTVDLPRTLWGVSRATRSDPGHQASVIKTLEDTPFYARSLVSSHLLGTPVTAMHESLSLTRFASTVVRLMLPFRMPRWWFR